MNYRPILVPIMVVVLIGCTSAATEKNPTPAPSEAEPLPTNTIQKTPTVQGPTPIPVQSGYEFPKNIDPAKWYLFYLHGKIIEDQGIPAISPDYGEYEYGAILNKLKSHGFTVISEQRPQNADVLKYARRTAE
jgi:hypothetical protein